MRQVRSFFAVMVSIGMVLGGCAKSNETNKKIVVTSSLEGKPVLVGDIECSFPLVDDETKLNIFFGGYGDIVAENIFVWDKYEQMTGVDINWTTVKKNKRSEMVYNALVNKQDVDLIMRCKISSSLVTQYGESGLIIDLAKNDLLKKNAPNCWAFLQSHPDALASITNPDGTIYSLPQVNSGAELRVSRKILINKTWLNNVGMDVPTTLAEFYSLLKAFKEQDANGNGDLNDEIPLCSHDWLSIKDAFYGCFGLANRGVHNQIVDFDEQKSEVRFIESSDSYKQFLEYFNKLYVEGLIDSNIFTTTFQQWYNNVENDRVGVFANTNLATLPIDKADNWIAIEEPLEGPNGDKMCSSIRANFHSTGAAVIPSVCQNPELVLRWLDYFWTDEGTLFYHMGIENETFEVKDDSYDYMPFFYEKMKNDNVSFDDIVAQYSPYPGGGNPTVEIAPYFMGGEMDVVPANAAKKLFEYGPEEYWPCFTFTVEENERLNVIQTDITKYCDTMRVKFIMGVKPISEWDEYLSEIEKLNKKELLNIYNSAVTRYEKLKADSE